MILGTVKSRPLKNAPFCPIFRRRRRLWRDKRRQTQILILEILKGFLAVPMKIGRVKFFAFLDLEQN
jgi:hypothetical protein